MKEAETNGVSLKQYTWEEVSQHNKKDDRWLVVEGKVYNVTNWMYKHPGGRTILGHYAGQDASVSSCSGVGMLLHFGSVFRI